MKDPYAVLGIRRAATQKEIQRAYRRLARAFHPDLFAHAPPAEQAQAAARFQEIAAAYEALRDQKRRAAFDRGLDLEVLLAQLDGTMAQGAQVLGTMGQLTAQAQDVLQVLEGLAAFHPGARRALGRWRAHLGRARDHLTQGTRSIRGIRGLLQEILGRG